MSVFKSDLYAKVDIQSVTGLALFPENIKGNYCKFILFYINLDLCYFIVTYYSSIANFYHTVRECLTPSSKKSSFLFNFCPLTYFNIKNLLHYLLLYLKYK